MCTLIDLCVSSRSDVSEDEMDEEDIGKIIIVTQTPAYHHNKHSVGGGGKHPGGDRTSHFTSRPKITSDLAQAINDGLYYYEQDLYSEVSDSSHTVSKVGQPLRPCVCVCVDSVCVCVYPAS